MHEKTKILVIHKKIQIMFILFQEMPFLLPLCLIEPVKTLGLLKVPHIYDF